MSYQAELDAITDDAARHQRALEIIVGLDPDRLGAAGVALAANLVANMALYPQRVVEP